MSRLGVRTTTVCDRTSAGSEEKDSDGGAKWRIWNWRIVQAGPVLISVRVGAIIVLGMIRTWDDVDNLKDCFNNLNGLDDLDD